MLQIPPTEIFRPVFLCVLLAGTALPLVAVLAERLLLRTASASARHRLWSLTAVGLLLFPGLVLLVRGNTERPAAVIVAEPIVLEKNPAAPAIPFADIAERQPQLTETGNFVPEESAPRVAAKTQAEHRPFAKIDFAAAATRVWLCGTVLFLLHYLGVRVRSFFALLPLRFANTFDAESVAGIRLIRSEKTAIPFAFGMLRPVIVFPVTAAHWPDEKIRAVLQHERAHIVRRDLFWQNVVHISRAVYWFHPLVWFLTRRVRIEQELACDDMVLQSGQRSSDYANVLLDLSKSLSFQERIPTGGLAMVRQKTVVKRIDSILDEKTSRQPIGRKGTLGILLGLGLLSLAVSFFAPRIPLPVFSQNAQTSVPKATHYNVGEDGIEIRGRILLPDGSPAPESLLNTSRTYDWSNISLAGQCSDKNGGYKDKALVGSYYIACVNSSLKPGDLTDNLASSVVATVITDPPTPGQFDIQLQEGVRVHGSLLYENGKPAAGKTVFFKVYPFKELSTVPEKDNLNNGRGLGLSFSAKSDEKGDFSKALLPGEYVVSTDGQFGNDRNTEIVLNPDEKEFRLDLTLPNPTEGQVFLPDGSPAANLEIVGTRGRASGNNSESSEIWLKTDAEGRFLAHFSPQTNMLQLATEDGKYGLVRYLEGNERNEPLRLVLQPVVTGKVRLISSATGKPIAGHPLRYAPRLAIKREPPRSFASGYPVQTKSDSEGRVELDRLYVGGQYELGFEWPQGVETYPYFQCEFTPAEPGELIDLGEKRVDGDFKDYEKAGPTTSATDTKTEGDVTTFALTVLDEAGRSIPHAKLFFGGMPAPLESEERMEDAGMGKAEADENGRFVMSFPVKKLADIRCLFFWIDTPGYAPYNGFWDRPEADPIPSEFSVKLEKGTTVGGLIQNADGKPVAGAKVTVYIPWENRCRGETNSNVHSHEIETDENGRWKYESYPVPSLGKEEPRHLFRINHDDYMTTEIYPQYSDYLPDAEGLFTKVSVLEDGIPVKGRVTDENGKPVVDALVVGEYRSTMETARLKTNENGEFLIRNWPEHKDHRGKDSSYLAVRKPGYKTALESFDISRNAPPVVDFTLKPIGKSIKIRIIDKDGKPVPGFMIGIEQWKKSRLIALDMLTGKENQFARTDQNGQWTWIEAPEDEVIFDMLDGKHMDLRQVPLKARDEEYVLTVAPGLKISGKVLDAETEETIPEFQVYLGEVWKEKYPIEFRPVPNVGRDGRYRIDETYPQLYFQVKIEAQGYEPSTSRKILSDEGAITVDFKLKKNR